jgi:predicted rRNA methylase YqxC with S4 and FtsJ domains
VTVSVSLGERRYRGRCIEKLGFDFRGDERLLDVGCSDGGVATLLRRRVGEVAAVDVESTRTGTRVPAYRS